MPYLLDSDVLIDISHGERAVREYVATSSQKGGQSRKFPLWN
jgi:hypothetical protein